MKTIHHASRLTVLFVLFAVTLSLRAAPATQLKVMSFNIWLNGGESLTKCINAINTSGADIVGVQECDGPTAQTMASQLGFYWLQSGSAGQYVILSRYPIVNRIGETAQAYGGLGATIELSPDQRVHFFCAHLHYLNYGPYSVQDGKTSMFIINQENSTRMPGLNELLGMASPFVALDEPAFLVGDFNAPSHLDYASLAWPESVACYNSGLADSYRELHPANPIYPPAFAFDDPGITWTPIVSQEPRGAFDRIDFVYFSMNDDTAPLTSAELDARNSVSPWPSDHRAVLTTFSLVPPPRLVNAGNPVPPNAAATAPLRPLLTWVPGTNTTSHNIYFGITNPGVFQRNQTDSKFSPGLLAPNTTYYWRIDEVKAGGTTTGDVWSFRTGNFASAQPGQTNYARNAAITIAFSNGPGSTKDWIGLYAANAPYGSGGAPAIDWFYLNGSKTAPKKGLKNGSITFASGLPSAGTYKARYFANDGFTILDEVTFTVAP